MTVHPPRWRHNIREVRSPSLKMEFPKLYLYTTHGWMFHATAVQRERWFYRLPIYRLPIRKELIKQVSLHNTYKSSITKWRPLEKKNIRPLATFSSFFAEPAAKREPVWGACCQGKRGRRMWPWLLPWFLTRCWLGVVCAEEAGSGSPPMSAEEPETMRTRED